MAEKAKIMAGNGQNGEPENGNAVQSPARVEPKGSQRVPFLATPQAKTLSNFFIGVCLIIAALLIRGNGGNDSAQAVSPQGELEYKVEFYKGELAEANRRIGELRAALDVCENPKPAVVTPKAPRKKQAALPTNGTSSETGNSAGNDTPKPPCPTADTTSNLKIDAKESIVITVINNGDENETTVVIGDTTKTARQDTAVKEVAKDSTKQEPGPKADNTHFEVGAGVSYGSSSDGMVSIIGQYRWGQNAITLNADWNPADLNNMPWKAGMDFRRYLLGNGYTVVGAHAGSQLDVNDFLSWRNVWGVGFGIGYDINVGNGFFINPEYQYQGLIEFTNGEHDTEGNNNIRIVVKKKIN